MEKRWCHKAAEKAENDSFFEVVEVKVEPTDGDLLQTVEVSESGNSSSNQQKPKVIRSKRVRATQVYPEDIDKLAIDATIPSVPGENEPIKPEGFEPTIPQCRFCLRRVSQANLRLILSKHKPKALAAFKIKIFPNDAYPLACCNCLNLLDILVDFKDSVLKARHLLLSKRSYLESEGWDDPSIVETITKCRTAVELHKKVIDELYAPEHLKVEPANLRIKKDEDAVIKNSIDDLISSCVTDENVVDVQLSNGELILKPSPQNSADEDDDNEESYVPSSAEDSVHHKKKKGVPRRKKQKQPKEQTTVKSQQLCDFCGERICPQSAEGHRNRHLGVKPYKCPAIGCELTFYSRFNQSIHVKRAHGEKGVPVHECDICGKQIRGPLGVLKYHQRRHNVENKNFVCQVCGKGFTMRWYLTQHSIIHSGEFPYKCGYCGKRFNNKWSMKTHEKNIHEKRNHVPMSDDQPADVSSYENNDFQ